MRFTTAAAVMATSVMAHGQYDQWTSTAYATELVTVTSCAPEVTNCPAHEKTTSVATYVYPTSSAVVTSEVPMTTSTVLTTKVHTITSCAPTVTNCPAHSTVYSTETIAVSTTVCPVSEVTPSHYGNNTVPSYTKPGYVSPPAQSSWSYPPVSSMVPSYTKPGYVTPSPAGPSTTVVVPPCESTSVTAITKSYTTVLTTVEYSTIVAACPTGGAGSPQPSGSTPAKPSPPPASSGSPPAGNGTAYPPPVTAGAASFAGSAVFAAVAGVAAFVFA